MMTNEKADTSYFCDGPNLLVLLSPCLMARNNKNPKLNIPTMIKPGI